ncbi:hypothetical protein HK100_008130 [Physocladia obscura]|uniref:Uncharacterized protein n=1 Tax=Physocladia obscura TaxID=109957 RepID=A0AAD5SPF1_9FUNG|nr:hypothetical protein HK100_008130 [Physocladia obscura]
MRTAITTIHLATPVPGTAQLVGAVVHKNSSQVAAFVPAAQITTGRCPPTDAAGHCTPAPKNNY